MTKANLLIATAQNNQAMNLAADQAARHFLTPLSNGSEPEEGMLNRLEAAIRCYDPCLSCSTHALGQMPLVVEVYAAGGTLVRRIARGA
jgi:NAD-reducing hydrogenase large subunit